MEPAPASVSPKIDPTAGGDKVIDYYAMWAPLPIKVLIMADKGYVVFLDENDELDWQTHEWLDGKFDETEELAKAYNEVLNRGAELNSLPVEHLSLEQRKNFRIMIGEGFARLFDLDPKCALEIMDIAGRYAEARNQEIARGWQLRATGLVAGIFSAVGFLGWLARDYLRTWLGQTAFILSIGACAGALGALFSILARIGTIPLDPSAGKSLHQLEGAARVVAGAVGALIAQLAVHLSLIFGVFKSSGNAALIFVALIAGASERLVPTIIKRSEEEASPKKK